ncbi:MAG: 50S ribosomal protein L25 [bacterium]
MITISVKIRATTGKKVKFLREKGIIPAVIYGPQTKPLSLEVDLKEFQKAYSEVGENALASIEFDQEGKKVTELVLIHEVKLDPISLIAQHVDFYKPNLEEEVTVAIPVEFIGEAPAVKDLGGTLVKNLAELEVKARPQLLPKEITIDISLLRTFEDHILVKDMKLIEGVKFLQDPDEFIVFVSRPENIEEELKRPIEEKVEEVEKVKNKKESANKDEEE